MLLERRLVKVDSAADNVSDDWRPGCDVARLGFRVDLDEISDNLRAEPEVSVVLGNCASRDGMRVETLLSGFLIVYPILGLCDATMNAKKPALTVLIAPALHCGSPDEPRVGRGTSAKAR